MIKPIETKYKGYRFRSRLEARWAVFFDAMGVRWEYEVEGFDLGEAGWYLPDFWLPRPEWGFWVEIKPYSASIVEEDKCKRLSLMGHPVALLSGPPWPEKYDISVFVDGDLYRPEYPGRKTEVTQWALWGECNDDKTLTGASISVIGQYEKGKHCWPVMFPESAIGAKMGVYFWPCTHNDFSGCLMNAYTAARSARFEHGETPR